MLGIIGLGQAGGTVADLFAERGFLSMAINYSEKDLESLDHLDLKLHLVGSEGVGRERSKATKLIQNNWETAVSFIRNNVSQSSIQMILVVFATGGGSGSGIAPVMCDLLSNEFENKVIVACPILPDSTESTKAQINSLECLKELSELDICILTIDNAQRKERSKSQLYRSVNESFVKDMVTIVEHTEMNSKYGNMDTNNLLSLFSAKGFAHISYADISKINESIKLSKETVTEKIIQSWQQSIFTKPSLDKIHKFGLIFNGQECLMDYLDIQSYCSQFKNLPLTTFEGYYNNRKGDVYTILTGLQFNTERLNEIETNIVKQTEILSNVLTQSHSISIKPVAIKLKPVEKKKKPLSDIIKKYK
ncbi:tubulin-like doman-containing protein [Heyndrickxia acidicola]|uniref:Tubulin-like doman-containing protein n=1 Tax=Heyndrickxia acidicola TaxID=209389 RepID=A0ABU6MMQ8_9BACI|nr:tubulin-like doman-containing protein [Heyndrickxia acidicola]MED1205976.1 tubulin-like doman-containing protein [Heyndrickxia acidicola]